MIHEGFFVFWFGMGSFLPFFLKGYTYRFAVVKPTVVFPFNKKKTNAFSHNY